MYSNSNITKPIHCELDNSVLIYSKSLNSFLFQSPRFKLSITKFEYSFKSNVLFSVKYCSVNKSILGLSDQSFVSSVADKRNTIPRKSLNYQTPLEVFLS